MINLIKHNKKKEGKEDGGDNLFKPKPTRIYGHLNLFRGYSIQFGSNEIMITYIIEYTRRYVKQIIHCK